jgi:hypothetical protein
MSVKSTSKWLTVCLYYNEPWEEFLVKAVKPYVDVVTRTGVADRFYFQRSWERGPNIRLWFKSNSFVLESMLKPNLNEHFQQYFESRPSLMVEPDYPGNFPNNLKWHPNNSIRLFDVKPELERYGGKLEWSICAKQFEASSFIVLQTIKEKATRWTYNEMLGTAIKLHLSMTYAAGMNQAEAASFFQVLFNAWKYKNLRKEDTSQQDSLSSLPADGIIRSFQKLFDLQKKDVVPYHSALWELFKNFHHSEDKAFVNWFHVNANVSLELSLSLENGKLQTGSGYFPKGFLETERQESLWNFYAEFVLKTNNRLGIHQKHEGYLLYTMAQSLAMITSDQSAATPVKVNVAA